MEEEEGEGDGVRKLWVSAEVLFTSTKTVARSFGALSIRLEIILLKRKFPDREVACLSNSVSDGKSRSQFSSKTPPFLVKFWIGP